MKKHLLLALTCAAGVLASAAAASAQSNYEPYNFRTLAGVGYGSVDGTGRAARFYQPLGVATDSAGNVYVADTDNHTIRKVTRAGVTTTLAGRAGSGGSADGTGSAARFYFPTGVATDSAGNVYVADRSNHTIRKVTPAGVVTTLAGLAGYTGRANGTGSAARFYNPSGVATDSTGNVYVADQYNDTIRKISPGGVVTTLAGLAGSFGSGSADGTGSAARFYYPTGVATDSAGNVYVADQGNDTIRKVTPGGVVTTVAGLAGSLGSANGTGSAARFNAPSGVATDSAGNVYVADSGNDTIRKVTPGGLVTTLAGLAGSRGSADGTGSAARFDQPYGVATDSAGSVYVSDRNNNTIRKVTSGGLVTTLAGLAGGAGSADGTGSAARFYQPSGVATDGARNVYVADRENHTIRKVTSGGVVTTLAGLAGSSGSVNGTGSAARFYYPSAVATDSAGNVYVADQGNDTIRKVTPGGVVTTVAGLARSRGSADGTGNAARFSVPSGVATDSAGNVYVADSGNDTIRKVTPGGVVTTLAGLAGSIGSADGTGSAARFYGPAGVATDRAGNVYVADQSNYTIRKITPGGVVTTLAGLAGSGGSADGTGSAARFFYPSGVATDSAGNVFVADHYNDTIRKVTPGGVVTTLAGLARSSGSVDGTGSAARFYNPSGVATDSAGNVYVADTGNNTIRAGMVPGSTGHFEAEALNVKAISPVPAGFTGTWYGVFNSTSASGGSAASFNATAIGNYVTYTVPVAKAGTYHVRVGVQTKASKGIFQLAINGVNQGSPQDEYSPSVTYGMRDLGTVTLSSGQKAFKFYVTGKNPSSSGYSLVFDYIELVP